MGGYILAGAAGLLWAGAVYGGLSFQSTLTGNTAALVAGGGSLVAGAILGAMGAPDIGLAVAAGGGGAAAAQFATAEAAAYIAGNPSAPAPGTTPTVPAHGINSVGEGLPFRSFAENMSARSNLRAIMR